jgi:hypothetical protein
MLSNSGENQKTPQYGAPEPVKTGHTAKIMRRAMIAPVASCQI